MPDVACQFEEMDTKEDSKVAADLAEHAGRKKVQLGDLKMARTLAAMLRRTF